MSFKNAFTITGMQSALEAQAGNVTSGREDELVVYAKVNDFEGLKKAISKESHEQWQVNAPFGKIRVRKTGKDGLAPQYSMAIKTRDSQAGIPGGSETEMDIDETVFNAFKVIADKGMIKDRYCFNSNRTTVRDDSGKQNLPAANLVYEVDMFPNGQGSYHEICKIDIELNDLLDKVKESSPNTTQANLTISVSDLPFRPSNPILGTTENAEEKAIITKYYDDFFLARRGANDPVDNVTSQPAPVQENTESPSNESPDADAVVEEKKPAEVTEVLKPDPVPEPIAEPVTEKPVEETPPPVQETPTEPVAAEPPPATEQPVEAPKPEATSEVRILQKTPQELFGKSFEGTQSGYKVQYEVDGKIHEIELETGVRGKDIPVTVTYDGGGNPSVTMKKDQEAATQ